MPGPRAEYSQPVMLRLSPACDLGEVRAAVQSIREFLKEQNWNEEALMSFELALVEACNNAVRYVDESNRKRLLLLETICSDTDVEFRIHDHTPGFKWPEKIELPAPESESGRGLYLIHQLMDSVGYFRGQSENVMVMRKARPAETTNATKSIADNDSITSAMVEELSSCYECLSAIFRYTNDEGKSRNLKQFAMRLGNDLLQIVSAEWFIIRLVSKTDGRLTVFATSDSTLEFAPLTFPAEGSPANSVELEAAITRRLVWFDFERPMPPLGPIIKAKPGSSGVAHPITLGEEMIGTLTLGKPVSHSSPRLAGELVFTAGQMNVINTLCDFLAIQIANARFQEQQVSQRLVRHELEIANTIQQSLLLSTLPRVEGFSLAAFCRSAHEVGGDFYDVLKIDEHSLLLVIADVMGKGIPAAMFAAMLRTLIRAVPELMHRPAALLERVNRLLYPELSGVDMFITAQLAFVDSKQRKITVAAAGHCPMALATSAGVKTFSPEGMPLGIQAETIFEAETVDLPTNCHVLIYTDGLTDAINVGKEHFGQDRLMEWLARSVANGGTADQLKEKLAGELAKHQSDAALSDDQTFLILAG